VWEEQTAHIVAPTGAGSGVALNNAPSMRWLAKLREDVSKRTGRLTSLVHTPTDTYTVTVGGNAVAYVSLAGSTFEDVVNGLVAALPGVPAADALVTFVGVDVAGLGALDTLLIQGKAEAEVSLAITTTGTSTTTLTLDASTATARVFLKAGPQGGGTANPDGWHHKDVEDFSLTYRGISKSVPDVGGWDRAAVELASVAAFAGDAAAGNNVLALNTEVQIGPCAMESTT